jgi:hypothetical protein
MNQQLLSYTYIVFLIRYKCLQKSKLNLLHLAQLTYYHCCVTIDLHSFVF